MEGKIALSTNSKKNVLSEVIKHKELYIILLPTVIYYIIFHYFPMIGNIIAFQDYSVASGILGSKWIGWKHFTDFLSNYKFWQLIRNTLSINLYGLLFAFPAPIILALLLNEVKRNRFKRTVQTVTYLPHFISVVVAVVIVLDFVSANGMINHIRMLFGLDKIVFMTQPKYFYSIYVMSDIWQHIGWGSIIYIAALSGINVELYEAAYIDGAGRWKQMIHVTLPGIIPTIVILFILRIGQMLNVGFEKVLLLYNPSIYETADVISTYVYRRGILNLDYSYSTAVNLFNSVFNLALLISANTISKKLTSSSLW